MRAKNLVEHKILVLVITVMSISVCTTVETDVIPGSAATTTSSPDFEFTLGLRIAVLPFTVLGNPDRTTDISEADRLSMKLQEIGFTVIESLSFQQHKLNLQSLIPEDDWESVREVLNIDYLVFGTIDYTYNPGNSLIGKGRYYRNSASVRFVDAKTGEVMVIATVGRVPGSQAEEIGESIKNHLFRD